MTSTALHPPRLTTLILLSALSVISLNMFLPSLPNIAREFEADYGLVTLAISGYAAATAAIQLIAGPLSDRFGRRPVILLSLVLYIAASVGCLMATDITTFLVCRLFQAAVISAHTISLAVIRDTNEPKTAASLMGYVAMAWAIAPMVGPTFGGFLDDALGWRASFAAFFVFGLIMLLLCWIDLRETNHNRATSFIVQFRAYGRLISSPRFWGYALCMSFSIGAFYAFLGGAPLVATHLFEMSPAMLGVTMGTTTAGFMFGSFLSGVLAKRTSLMSLILAGRLIACFGLMVGIGLLLADIMNAPIYFAACACMGAGNGLTLPGGNAGAMSVLPELTGSAAGLSGALVLSGGAVMSAITGAVLTPSNAPITLLVLMLMSSVLALVAALYVRWLESVSTVQSV
ncbi:MAG: multidrug effflux MFS transporter [Rhodobacteraceae bacterium]|nr:multidrug effflux MFS transporter [Paracoccaceae bacterium]